MADPVIALTRRWIATVVIGLNLCPFARRVFDADAIRYVVTDTTAVTELLELLAMELALLAAPECSFETTLLIHPNALADFPDYNDFLAVAEQLVDDRGFTGVIQIASFHPQYQFGGTSADAVENSTNRSPYPMLHLLREESITLVNSDPDKLNEIPERNVETMRRLGRGGVEALLASVQQVSIRDQHSRGSSEG